jgi:hypothetical protein
MLCGGRHESHQRAGRLIAAAQSQNNKAVTFHTLGVITRRWHCSRKCSANIAAGTVGWILYDLFIMIYAAVDVWNAAKMLLVYGVWAPV